MNYEEEDRKFARSEEDEAWSESMQPLSDSDSPPDQELKSFLQHWSAPSAPARLDSRVMATYRRQVGHRSWWLAPTSLWPTSLPARLALGASLCLLAFVIFQRGSSHRNPMTGPSPKSSTVEGTDVEISGGELHYITYISGSGFQPVRPVRIQISRGSDQNEN
jgi:hypothetical protein